MSIRSLWRGLVLLTSGAAVVGMLQGAPVHAEETGQPTRILLYGDSYLMGFSGDWTVRFRLWQQLDAGGASFDLVGPRNDVRGYMSGWWGSQGYRYADFDRDHAAVAGMALTNPRWEASTLTAEHQADVVVGMIGFNDLIRGLATPDQLAEEWRRQVAAMRTIDPAMDVVLVQYPATWFTSVAEYNDHLIALADELDTPASRVLVTSLASFDKVKDTFDGAHPSAAGERKLAGVIAEALAALGDGTLSALSTTEEPRTARWAPKVGVTAEASTLSMSWPWVDYASAMDVVVQDVTSESSSAWKVVRVQRVKGQAWSLPVASGRRYRVWLLPVKGYLRMGTKSPKVEVAVP